MVAALSATAANAGTIFDTLPRNDHAGLGADCGQTWMTGILGVTNKLKCIEVANRSSGAGGGKVYLAVYKNGAASGSAASWSKGDLVAVSSNTQDMSVNGAVNTFNFGYETLSDNTRYLYTFVDASTNGVNVGIGVTLNTGDAEQGAYTSGGIAFSGSHTIASRITTDLSAPLDFQGATTIQTTAPVPRVGICGVAALEITSSGNMPANAVTSLTYNLNGTTDPSDIEEVRLYDNGASSVFDEAAATLLETQAPPAGGPGIFSINRKVTTEKQYLWVAIKLRSSSSYEDIVDAQITEFSLVGPAGGTHVPTVTAPPEHLTVSSEALYSTVIRNQGDDGVHTYRIPGLVTTTNGTLIAVFDLRHNGGRDLPANVDVGIMRSTDGGFSWNPMQVIMDYNASVSGSRGNGVGDPAILVDRVTGRIWCAALWSFGNRAWNGSGPGLTKTETGQLVLNYSDDDGLTWSDPVSITAEVKDPAWRIFFQGPGKGICTRNGTLIFPTQFRENDAGKTARSNFIYSTDQGATWHTAPPVLPTGTEWTTETQIVELDNGDLLLTIRNYDTTRLERMWCVYSWDHDTQTIADGTWGTPWYDQNDPICQASVERYSSVLDGDAWSGLLFSNPDSRSIRHRKKMSIQLSLDEGRTWAYKKKIDDRPAAYSCMTMLPDGDIGILYETGNRSPYETLTFARFSLDWLVGADDSDGDGISDFEESLLRGPPKPLTELRATAPASLIPFPRDLKWLPEHCDASRVAIMRPSGTNAVLLHAEHLLTNALAEAGAVVNPPAGTETCTITLVNDLVTNPDGSDEIYTLETTSNSVTITAPTNAGLLYGVQTLCQLLIGPTHSPQIAGCSIIDWPAFGIRGFMHDVGRNFQPIELLKTQVDAFARYKLNTFHWHLTEHAAWRIESKLYPQLTNANNHWPTREPGKFYTQAEIVDFVDYCAARNITVTPEIDIPGHSQAFRKAMKVSMRSPLAVEYLTNIVNEVCDLHFPLGR